MNCRMASSVCGEVGFAAMELEDAREEAPVRPPPKTDEEAEEVSEEDMKPPPPVADVAVVEEEEEGSCGGWCSRMNRAPEGVRNAEMCAAVGG